jgi:hypothetical protein
MPLPTRPQELMTAFEAMHRQQQSSRRVRRNSAGGAATASEAAAPEHDCLKSIHRCLIFLGDLARWVRLWRPFGPVAVGVRHLCVCVP